MAKTATGTKSLDKTLDDLQRLDDAMSTPGFDTRHSLVFMAAMPNPLNPPGKECRPKEDLITLDEARMTVREAHDLIARLASYGA